MNTNSDLVAGIIKEAYYQYFVSNRSVWITELILLIIHEKGINLTQGLYEDLQNREDIGLLKIDDISDEELDSFVEFLSITLPSYNDFVALHKEHKAQVQATIPW